MVGYEISNSNCEKYFTVEIALRQYKSQDFHHKKQVFKLSIKDHLRRHLPPPHQILPLNTPPPQRIFLPTRSPDLRAFLTQSSFDIIWAIILLNTIPKIHIENCIHILVAVMESCVCERIKNGLRIQKRENDCIQMRR